MLDFDIGIGDSTWSLTGPPCSELDLNEVGQPKYPGAMTHSHMAVATSDGSHVSNLVSEFQHLLFGADFEDFGGGLFMISWKGPSRTACTLIPEQWNT